MGFSFYKKIRSSQISKKAHRDPQSSLIVLWHIGKVVKGISITNPEVCSEREDIALKTIPCSSYLPAFPPRRNKVNECFQSVRLVEKALR